MTDAFAAWLFAATWKGTLLVALVLLIHRLLKNRIPSRWLCALLLVALVRLLAPMTPATSFSVFNLVPTSVSGAPVAIVMDGGPRPAEFPRKREAPPLEAPAARTPWIPALLAVWAAGAALALARTGQHIFRFHRQLADRIDVARDDVTMLVDDCRARLGVRRRIRVASTGAVATPSLHGWLRPTLLLPPGFLDSFTREQLRYVVLHELAHLRRSDVLVNWIATAAQVLHWFNPLVRLAVARLAEERELACDALALEALEAEERPAYGGTVLEIVERLRTAPLVPALVGMTATPQQLKRRIMMIASFRRQSRHSLAFTALVATIALVTLTDARAGEMHMKRRSAEPLSPATKIIVDSLEKAINLQFTDARLEDVLYAIGNATGTSITIADGALSDEARDSRITLTGTNIPAHLVLFETLSAVDLAVKFTDSGIQVIAAPEGHEGIIRMRVHEGERTLVPEGEPKQHVMIMRESGEPHDGEPTDRIVRKMVEATVEPSADGTTRRKVTFRSEGSVEGTLELSVRR